MYDVSLDPSNLQKPKKDGVCTRSNSKKLLKIRRPKKFKGSLTYRGPKKWNALPEEVQRASTKQLFKWQVSKRIELKAEADNVDIKDYA